MRLGLFDGHIMPDQNCSLCYKVFCLGSSSVSVKSFVSLNPIVLKFEVEVFFGVVLQYSVRLLGLKILLESLKTMDNNCCPFILDL